MAEKSRKLSRKNTEFQKIKADPQISLHSGSWSEVREEYDKKYPLFGSQIHFAIDVIRQTIKDIRRK